MATYEFDAIVIGSGISGGWAAKELTEHGLRTLQPGESTGAWMQLAVARV